MASTKTRKLSDITLKMWAKICLSYRNGLSIRGIADRFGLSSRDVRTFIRRWRLERKAEIRHQIQLKLFR